MERDGALTPERGDPSEDTSPGITSNLVLILCKYFPKQETPILPQDFSLEGIWGNSHPGEFI